MVPRKKKGKSKASNTKFLCYFFFYHNSEAYNKLILFLYMCFVIKTKEIILFAVMSNDMSWTSLNTPNVSSNHLNTELITYVVI